MKFLLVTWLMFALAMAEEDAEMDEGLPAKVSQEDDSVKRRFSSYYLNYYDEIAMSVCASVPMVFPSHVFPLRRACNARLTCSQLCKSSSVRKQVPWGYSSDKFECIDSLHIYKGRPSLAPNPGTNTDVARVGLVLYRYHGCSRTDCGPNYCCCRKGR